MKVDFIQDVRLKALRDSDPTIIFMRPTSTSLNCLELKLNRGHRNIFAE